MKDLAIQRPHLQIIETTSKEAKNYYALRKLFGDYLNKLNVAFFDTCCPTMTEEGIVPVRFNATDGTLEYYDITSGDWIDAGSAIIPDPLQIGALEVSSYVKTPWIANTTTPPIQQNTVFYAGGNSQSNVSATITAANFLKGLLTSATVAPVTITLPSVTNILAQLPAAATQTGTVIQFTAMNEGVSTNALTIAVGGGMTIVSPLTGGTTMTVADGKVGVFLLTITSSTTGQLARIA